MNLLNSHMGKISDEFQLYFSNETCTEYQKVHGIPSIFGERTATARNEWEESVQI